MPWWMGRGACDVYPVVWEEGELLLRLHAEGRARYSRELIHVGLLVESSNEPLSDASCVSEIWREVLSQ